MTASGCDVRTELRHEDGTLSGIEIRWFVFARQQLCRELVCNNDLFRQQKWRFLHYSLHSREQWKLGQSLSALCPRQPLASQLKTLTVPSDAVVH